MADENKPAGLNLGGRTNPPIPGQGDNNQAKALDVQSFVNSNPDVGTGANQNPVDPNDVPAAPDAELLNAELTASELEALVDAGGQVHLPKTESGKMYASTIRNLKVGPFKFQDGTLALDKAEDIEKFEGILDSMPIAERNRIKTINLDLAHAIAARPVPGRATQGMDGTGNRSAEERMRALVPKVGTKDDGTKANPGN